VKKTRGKGGTKSDVKGETIIWVGWFVGGFYYLCYIRDLRGFIFLDSDVRDLLYPGIRK